MGSNYLCVKYHAGQWWEKTYNSTECEPVQSNANMVATTARAYRMIGVENKLLVLAENSLSSCMKTKLPGL
jgi:hypothetical protein